MPGRVEHSAEGPEAVLAGLVSEGTLDAELAALLWLLADGGVPVLVAGGAARAARVALLEAILGAVPARARAILDVQEDGPTLETLSALSQHGVGLGLTVGGSHLRDVLAGLETGKPALPADAIRRLGVVLFLDATAAGLRVTAAHYLRPTERDAQGHVQRRAPAVLATWDGEADRFEHFAWGITPELGDRIDRSQADLEERQRDRAALLEAMAAEGTTEAQRHAARLTEYLATEPPRVPAPAREPARPSPFRGGLADPHVH